MQPVRFDHYLAGVVGLGLMRHWYADGDANAVRMAELAEVLSKADEPSHSFEVNPTERSIEVGYAEWAATYDGRNPMIDLEESVVVPMLERLARPGQRALDAACGTGRHARLLDACGCVTTGIDQSIEMLEMARSKVPGAAFDVGDVERLPFDDDAFDVAVAALALCHLADPTTAVVELGRVLAPGGTLVVSDPHPMGGILGGQAYYGGVADGRRLTFVRNHRHGASTWLRAFAAAGLAVVDCVEVAFTDEQMLGDPAAAFHPEAARAAFTDLASLWIWELRAPVVH
jgi:SAM-dependent methyltransferase